MALGRDSFDLKLLVGVHNWKLAHALQLVIRDLSSKDKLPVPKVSVFKVNYMLLSKIGTGIQCSQESKMAARNNYAAQMITICYQLTSVINFKV